MKILLVEDEHQLSHTIKQFLIAEGYIVEVADNAFKAEDFLLVNQYDLVLLDITLPDGSGLNLIPIIKETQKETNILIVSAKNAVDDKVKGLDLGADDYITKPFHLAELNSRIKAIIRRSHFQGKQRVEFNEIEIDIENKEVLINNKVVPFTKKEYELLLYFISNKNRVLTKEDIASHLWKGNDTFIESYDFIYAHIKNLRKKIILNGGNDYLKTVHGIGYKYTSE